MTYFTKIPSWAYEVFFERLTKVSSFFHVSFLKFLGLFSQFQIQQKFPVCYSDPYGESFLFTYPK